MTASRPRAVRRFVLVAVIAPAVVTTVAALLQLMAMPSLPAPIAIHWNAAGAPDGFGSAWLTLLLTIGVGLGLPLLLAAAALNGLVRGDRGPAYRLMGALAGATSVFLGVLMTASVLIQRGVLDAADGPSIVPWLLVAAVIALAAGIVAWLIQPDERTQPRAGTATLDPPLGTGERAIWLRSVRLARGGVIVLCAALALLVTVAIVTVAASGSSVAATILIALVALMAATIAATSAFHVRVDATGLAVTSVVGFPRVHIPVTQVARVEVVDVAPMGEFGGWGLRWAPGGGFGVVMRTGSAIRVHRVGGGVFTVTVDDAETGAALLAAEAERASGR